MKDDFKQLIPAAITVGAILLVLTIALWMNQRGITADLQAIAVLKGVRP